MATSLCLALFVLGITLDDLHLFRLPMLYLGALAAIFAYAFAPLWLADRLATRVEDAEPAERARRLASAKLRRQAVLALSIALFLAWLVLFSSGRTPRW
jgi:hypothetical protein